MQRAERAPTLRQAAVLGLLQGPTELLPISSSAHTALTPWLAGWPCAELDGELRKSFEVALHAGAGAALVVALRGELRHWPTLPDRRRRAGVLALALLPPALAGLGLRGQIERRLGGPRSIAAGLVVGAVAMAGADLCPASGGRACSQAGAMDGLALGIAQALALMPGVSRSGATLTAARARGFTRDAAQALSLETGLPVLLAASALEAGRLARGSGARRLSPALAAGAAAAFVSTLASAAVLRRTARGQRLLGYSLYRCLLAALIMRRLGRAQ